jgi:hypothetical protein
MIPTPALSWKFDIGAFVLSGGFWQLALDLEQIKANTNFKLFLPN